MPPKALEEGKRILHEADARGVTLRLLGGVAILHQCPSATAGPLARAATPDVDLAGLKKETPGIKGVFESLGYTPNQNFNAIHGYKRLMYHGAGGDPKVDVFLDRFSMCHDLDLRPRLSLAPATLPLADLLFTKLQVVQINEKDIRDITALFLDHEVATTEGEGLIDGAYLAMLAAEDWGIYTTLTDNLGKVAEALPRLPLGSAEWVTVEERISKLRGLLDSAPKRLAWRLRARVGRRVAWYEVPDEPRTIRLGEAP